ncbi:MAG: hypothetical protein ACE5HI_13340 [bacterium]
MKSFTILTISASLFLFIVAATAQEKKMDENMHKQMMQDSTMMNMMMEHIAKDDHMRMQMMGKMMAACKSDTSKMMGMCKMMMEDKDMHGMMMKMMGGDMQATETAGPEILVKFKPGVQAAQIKAMTEEMGLQKIKDIQELNIKVFKITSKMSLEEVIAHCEKMPFVEYAEPNQTYRTQKK